MSENRTLSEWMRDPKVNFGDELGTQLGFMVRHVTWAPGSYSRIGSSNYRILFRLPCRMLVTRHMGGDEIIDWDEMRVWLARRLSSDNPKLSGYK